MAKPKQVADESGESELPYSDPNSATALLAARVEREAQSFQAEKNPAYEDALRALRRIEKRHDLTIEQRYQLRVALANEIFGRLYEPELPDRAPELWSERKGTKENPVTFIRRVYALWLGRGLRRSHLHSLDRALYTALGVWLHRHRDTGFPELDS